MATIKPFATVDFTKYVADLKVPMIDVTKVVAAQKRNFDAVAAANRAVTDGLQALFHCQLAMARRNAEELAAALQELTSADAPQAKVARQAELTKEAYERAIANLKELNEALARTNGEVFELLNKRFVEGIDEVQGLVKT